MPYRPHLPPQVLEWGVTRSSKAGSHISEKPVTSVTTVTPAFQDQLAWRLEAMRRQVPQEGVIPDLIAREAPTQPGTCFSCGDPLKGNQQYRCRPCAVAAAIAIWGVCPDVVVAELAQRESS
jgi:hypothetical protein